jgi:putative ABC transport system permease protein
MNFFDLFFLILENLGRRKTRVALTAVGVVIGTAAVVVLVSLAIGLQSNATQQLWGISDLSRILVWPGYIEPSVMSRPGPGGPGEPGQQVTLTQEIVDGFAGLPGVKVVIPMESYYGLGSAYYKQMETWAGPQGVDVEDVTEMGLEVAQGDSILTKGTMIIGSAVPRNYYNPRTRPGQEPPPPPELVGETIKLVIVKWDAEGNEIKKTLQVRVIGILKETRDEADWAMYMHLDDVTAYNEWYNGRRTNRNKDGYQQVMVRAEDPKQVPGIADQISAMGYQVHAPQNMVQGINSFFIVMQVIFGGVGAIALLVAAIGIANTMAMAILERTREIGLMKAVGATNREVLSVFLGEAAGIGFLGGLGGVLIGWSAGQIINVLALAYLAGQAAQQGGPPPNMAVITPVWLPLFSIGFATLVGLLSGLYPALRAATLVPVNALKYE